MESNTPNPSHPFQAKPQFTISYILNHAWECTRGAKWPIWATALMLIVVTIGVGIIANILFGTHPSGLNYWVDYIITPTVTNILSAPLVAGLYMVAIKRTRNEAINATSGYQYFPSFIPTAITLVIISIVSSIPLLIVNWPPIARELGHSLATANLVTVLLAALVYTFWFIAIPLVTDKKQNPQQALAHSFRLISPVWLKTYGLIMVIYFFLIVSLLPFAIGFLLHNILVIYLGAIILIAIAIWLLPFIFMVPGVVYWLLTNKPN